nr:hypothetical protein [Shigella boydii]
MAQQAIKNKGVSGYTYWHLFHDFTEINATVMGHTIQLELPPRYTKHHVEITAVNLPVKAIARTHYFLFIDKKI